MTESPEYNFKKIFLQKVLRDFSNRLRLIVVLTAFNQLNECAEYMVSIKSSTLKFWTNKNKL